MLSCDTINGAWGYNSSDNKLKSTKQLVHYLVKAAGNNANFLLNVGPKPDGTIQDDFVVRLREIGSWMDKNSDSIRGTRGGPITPRPWGVTTRKGNKVYVHVLDWPDEWLLLPRMPQSIRKATLLSGGGTVPTKDVEGGLMLKLPAAVRDPIDTVVVLEG